MTNMERSFSVGLRKLMAKRAFWCAASVLVRYVIEFVPGNAGHPLLTGEFVTRMIRRAKDEELVYLAVHNHGGTTSCEFPDQTLLLMSGDIPHFSRYQARLLEPLCPRSRP